ncbi:MAG: GPR endopeptidase [Clostridia bacterium]|nr:GPR endopeptidase [Clostridia bacterium]
MFEKRTDLALEAREMHGEDSGIIVREENKDGFNVVYAEVLRGEGERLSGKSAGHYITVEIGKDWMHERTAFEAASYLLASELGRLLPDENGCVLVVGLGNIEITPDSLGPRVVRELLVTRHIEGLDPSLFESAGFASVAAVSPGVLAQTGIESAEIVESVCRAVKPRCVILIDSLASRRLNRLASTVQMSDVGLSPGSGVFNRRAALDKSTLGVPVISLGVPMVVDAATLAYDLLEEQVGNASDEFVSVIERVLAGNGREMFVTPKENDVIAKQTAKLLSSALNVALHQMEINEISLYLN